MSAEEMIVRAFQAILDPSTQRGERSQAEAHIEELKQTQDCVLHMERMIRSAHTLQSAEVYVQLAMSIYNDWLKIHWNVLSESNQSEVRVVTLRLLLEPPEVIRTTQSRAIRLKLASILCNLAERTFPQQWPTMLEDLVAKVWLNQAALNGPREICIACLEFLVTDCVDSDFNSVLPAQRRQDILTGLRNHLEIVLQTAYDYLMECCNHYASLLGAANQGTDGVQAEVTLVASLINTTTRMVDRLAQCSKVSEVFTEKHNFSVLAVSMLTLPQVQMEACNLLNTVVSQSHDSRGLYELCGAVVSTPVTSLLPDATESLDFQREYAGAIGALVSANISTLTDKGSLSDTAKNETLLKLLQLLCHLLEQPSRRVPAALLSDWLKIFREEGIGRIQWMHHVVGTLLNLYTLKGLRVTWEGEVPSDPVDELEFDDLSDYNDFKGVFNSQVKQLAEEVGVRFAPACAAFLLETVKALIHASAAFPAELASFEAGGPNHSQERVHAFLSDALVVRQWESLFLIMDALFKAICGKPEKVSPEAGTNLQQMVHLLVSWPIPSQPSALAFDQLCILRAKALQLSTPLLALPSCKADLSSVFITLHDCLLAPKASSHAAQRRKMMAVAIAHLCGGCRRVVSEAGSESDLRDGVMVPRLQQLLLSNDTELPDDAKSSIREAMVALSEGMSGHSARGNLLKSALADVVQHLHTSANSIFASPESLKLHISTQSSAIESLTRLVSMLEALYSSARRVNPPRLPVTVWSGAQEPTPELVAQHCHFFYVWREVLPLLLIITRSLHGLFSARGAGAGGLDEGYFSPTVNEVRNAAKAGSDSTKKRGGSGGDREALKGCLVLLRLLLYQLVGTACAHKAFYVCMTRQSFITDLFSHAPTMENVHASYFVVHVVEPMVLHCPACYYNEICSPLTAYLRTAVYRLGVAWGLSIANADPTEVLVFRHCSMESGGNGTGSGRNIDASLAFLDADGVESAKDYFIRDFTRKFADALAGMGLSRGALALPAEATKGGGHGSSPTSSGKKSSGGTNKGGSPSSSASSRKGAAQRGEEEALGVRRTALCAFTLSRDNVNVADEYIKACLALLSLPDTYACRKGVALTKMLLEVSISDVSHGKGQNLHRRQYSDLMPVVGKDFFQVALMVLLRRERWLVGLEWELTEVLQEIYCYYVLGLRDVTDRKEPIRCVCDAPRNVLLGLGVTTQAITTLDTQMCSVLSKKKRRDFMKDFIHGAIHAETALPLLRRAVGVGEGVTDSLDAVEVKQSQQNSEGHKAVKNISSRPKNMNAKAQPSTNTVFDASSLFGH